MKEAFLLKTASVLMSLHLAGHIFGHLGWRTSTDPVRQQVVNEMTAHRFPFMGALRSLGDYFEGYGWTGTIAMVFFACILWLSSAASEQNFILVKRILTLLVICLAAWSVIEFLFFFAFAGALTLITAILTACFLVISHNKQKIKMVS